MNVAGLLARAGRQHGAVEAIRFGEESETYAELEERARRLASGLGELGARPGDRVAILQGNGPRLVESLFACWFAGLVAVPVNSRAHPREAAYIVAHSGAAAVLVGGEHRAALVAELGEGRRPAVIATDGEGAQFEWLVEAHQPIAAAVEVAPEDVAWLFYTSGTTGRPKGAMLSHRNLRQMSLSHLADVRSFRPGELVLHAAPLTHGSGLNLLSCVSRGATNVIFHLPSFEGAAVLDLIERAGIESIAFLAPTQIAILTRAARGRERPGSLRSVCYGGAPAFAADLRAALEFFGPVFVQIYGQGESPMTITSLGPEDHLRFLREEDARLTSAGLPRADVEVAVVGRDGAALTTGATGEVSVRGDVVMGGYWDAPEASAAVLVDGWLRTGDIGRIDADGYLTLIDRSKDMIISGGNNIYPREVEEAISELDAVREVAVIGVEDEFWGESVLALVVLREGAELGEAEVIEHCRSRISSYKKPRRVEFVAALPVNAYGKVQKRELRNGRRTGSIAVAALDSPAQ